MDDLGRLREGFARAGYDHNGLRRLLGATSIDDIGVLNHPVAIERLRRTDDPLASLFRCFFLEQSEPAAALRRVLTDEVWNTAIRLRIVRVRGKSAVANLRLDPVDEQLYLSDLRFAASRHRAFGLPNGDPVYPPSSDSLLLSESASIPAGGEVLDLCAGSGVQAIRAAGAAGALTAVDINPRAVAMAEANARLNRVPSFQAHEGDLYGAVGRRRFDVIFANPPFVSSPYDDAPSFHAGGARGDRVLRRVCRGFERHLKPGGRGFCVSHVGLREEGQLEELAEAWFANFSGRAAVFRVEVGSALDLAAAQALFALRGGTAAYGREVRKWVAYLDQHRIAVVALILVAAELSGARSVEVIDAGARVFPLPMAPPPAERVRNWLSKT